MKFLIIFCFFLSSLAKANNSPFILKFEKTVENQKKVNHFFTLERADHSAILGNEKNLDNFIFVVNVDNKRVLDINNTFYDKKPMINWFVPVKESNKISKEAGYPKVVVILQIDRWILHKLTGKKIVEIYDENKNLLASCEINEENKKELHFNQVALPEGLSYGDLLPLSSKALHYGR